MMRFTCPCCGYKTLEHDEATCPVCEWRDDPYQVMDPDFAGGTNGSSLRQAQHRFIASNQAVRGYAKDRNWCAFAAPSFLAQSASVQIRYFEGSRLN